MAPKRLVWQIQNNFPNIKVPFSFSNWGKELEEGRHKEAGRSYGPCFVFRWDVGCSRSIQTNPCIQIRAIPPPTWAYLHSLAFVAPHIPSITQLLGSLQKQRDPRLELQRSQKYPNKLIFILCLRTKLFCLKSDSQAGWAVWMPQAPSLPAEGRAGAKAQRQKLELLLSVQTLAVSKKSGNGCWACGKMPALESNLNNRKGKFTYQYMQGIDFFSLFVFSQGESSLYHLQIAVWGLQAPIPLHNKFCSKETGAKVHTISTQEKCVASGKAVKPYTSASFQFNMYTILPQGVRLFSVQF